jgi:hypothetical protein
METNNISTADGSVISFEEVVPNPEYLIKSIAEQGYSLETSLADLIDNSITADARHIEVLINTDIEPFKLFIADDGDGMDKETLKVSMRFPSSFLENIRDKNDLGRFGLGLKTASFAQTRKFTVLSKKKGTQEYCGRTWDVDYLKSTGKWQIIINDKAEIEGLLQMYNYLSHNFNSRPDGFEANTIVIWHSLYKFEEYVNEDEDRKTTIKHQISEVTTEYLSLVFHRFLEKKVNPLFIKVNHRIVEPFNPFPIDQADFRSIENKQRSLGDDVVKLEGFVLPSRSIDESKEYGSIWSTKSKGLMDLEGIYIYRANRIIVFGGWNEIIRKSPILRLARLKVEVGNKVDHLFHLNVAKSQIIIPFNLQRAFLRYIVELKTEAEKEYYNRGVRQFAKKGSGEKVSLFEKKATSKGMLLEVNSQFPLLNSLKGSLNKEQISKLNFILKMVNTTINTIRHVHESREFTGVEENDGLSVKDIIDSIKVLKENGLTSKYIKENILPSIGYSETSIPDEILTLLK